MHTLDEIKLILSHMNLKKVADGSKVHYNAVYRLANGASNPSYETVQKIINYLEEQGILK